MTRTLIAGGLVLDGSGQQGRRADVLVDNDRIAEVQPNISRSGADVTIDASGRVVSPGFIDLHTHYDAQVFWDTALSSSCHHGVTSVINGNCGFSLAPYAREHRGIILAMLRDLEDMYPETLDVAVPPEVPSFAGYLADVEKCGPMLNFGSFIGHSTVRIAVMGEAAYERAATADEVAAMERLVDTALKAGAMGFATKTLPGARQSPSQFASAEETLALLKVLGAHGHGVAMFNPGGNFDVSKVYAHQQEIGRPFTWIALMAMPDGSHHKRLEMHREWRARGADVRPQVSCRALVSQCSMAMPAAVRAPAFTVLNAKTAEERLAAYASPEWRDAVRNEVRCAAGPMPWADVRIIASPSAPTLVGRDLASISREQAKPPFDALMDLAVADRLETKIEVTFGNGDVPEVSKLLNVEGAVLGLSDGGAHPAQICDAVMPTDLLGNWVRDRKTMPLELAVHKLTQEPAQLMGLAGRGLVAPGYYADLVVFDPATVGPGPFRTVKDLPCGKERLLADQPSGIHHILVNGVVVRQDERTKPAPSGRILRPN